MISAVLTRPGRFEFVERPVPEPRAGEALVRVAAVGICGTDVHGYHGTFPWMAYPIVLGHEVSGEIIDVGEGVSNELVGARVCVEPTITCGHCYPCRLGRTNCCVNMRVRGVHTDGGLCEMVSVPVDHLHLLPADISIEEGALVEPLSIGVQAAWRGGVQPGESVAILGAGAIGLSCLLAVQHIGARVLIADLLDSRLAMAREMGAEVTVNSSRESLLEAVEAFGGGEGANVVIDAVGTPTTVTTAAEITSSAGRMVVLGFSDAHMSLSIPLLIRKELDIRASRLNTGQFPLALQILSSDRKRARKLISHRFRMESVGEALELIRQHPEQTCKVLVFPA